MLFAGCSDKNSPADYEDAAAFVATSDAVALCEGLPHQDTEAKLLQQELAKHETITIGGYPFYPKPLSLTDADAATLRSILDGTDAFTKAAIGETKKCGGADFHPDFCATWTKGKETIHVLICFGCGEAKVVGHSTELHLHLAGLDLHRLLKGRNQSRPRSSSSDAYLYH